MLVFSCKAYLQCWWERKEKEKGRDVSFSLLVSWFLRSCIFITAGFSVWVGRYESRSVFSLCNARGKFRSVHCRGQPASFTHAAPWSSCTHQSGKTLSSECRWSRCVSSQWHQMTVTLLRGGHRCLAHVPCTTGLPPEINDSLCKTYGSNTQNTNIHPFLSQMLWGRAGGKKSEEKDFAKSCKSLYPA